MFDVGDSNVHISRHCLKRYVERVLKLDTEAIRECVVDIDSEASNEEYLDKYVQNNWDELVKAVIALLKGGVEVYRGKPLGGTRKNAHTDEDNLESTIVINGTYAVIYNRLKSLIVTILSIDLGLGEEFNKQYADCVVSRINSIDSEVKELSERIVAEKISITPSITRVDSEISKYLGLIEDLKAQKSEMVQNLENMKSKQDSLKNDKSRIVNSLIGRKIH